MTETGRPDARGRDLPEEYRNLSGKIGSPLQQSDQREIRHTIKKAKKFAQKARVKIVLERICHYPRLGFRFPWVTSPARGIMLLVVDN